MRTLLSLISIALALSVHLASDGSPQTPISFEIARQNPLAIMMFVALELLVGRLMYEFWVAGVPLASLTTIPILVALPSIALTSPESSIHLKIFALTASYGILWIAAISLALKKYFVAILSFVFSLFSVVFLFGFGAIKIFGGYLPDDIPLGIFQKTLIVLFAILCLEQRPREGERESG